MVISGTAKKLFSTFDGSVMHRSLRWSSGCRFILHRLVRSMQGCMQADQSASTFFSFFFSLFFKLFRTGV